MSQFFSTDRINTNTINTSQTFSEDGDGNLVVTETFQTTLTPEQKTTMQQSLQDQIDQIQSQSTQQVGYLQTLLDGITNI